MKKHIALTALLLLAACSSPEERAQQEAQKEIAACTKAGYQFGTPAFDDCRLQIRAQEDRRTADRVNALNDDTPPTQTNHMGSAMPSNGASIPLP